MSAWHPALDDRGLRKWLQDRADGSKLILAAYDSDRVIPTSLFVSAPGYPEIGSKAWTTITWALSRSARPRAYPSARSTWLEPCVASTILSNIAHLFCSNSFALTLDQLSGEEVLSDSRSPESALGNKQPTYPTDCGTVVGIRFSGVVARRRGIVLSEKPSEGSSGALSPVL